MTDAFRSALYVCDVAHVRVRPRRHALRHRICPMLIDLDELPALDGRLRLFAHGRFAPFSFHDADFGAGDGTPPREWVAARLAEAGLAESAVAIRTLAVPRIFGFAFNPLTVHYCFKADDRLGAVLYEVHNTFGERHGYLLPVDAGALASEGLARHSCGKDFHVSPFLDMDMAYDFTVTPPGETIRIAIVARDAQGAVMAATQTGRRVALSDAALLRALLAFPFQAFKIVAAIHWEAAKLWAKGVAIRPHRPATGPAVTARAAAPAGAPKGRAA